MKTNICKIKLQGNVLGTSSDIIKLWNAIEKNYISILAYDKIISEVRRSTHRSETATTTSYFHEHNPRDLFIEYNEKYNVSDIVSPDEYPIISRISFHSPGFWEVLASWNPFEQIRAYIKERHSRINDKKYIWELDRKMKEAEIESKRLSNDLLKLDISQKMIVQLKEIGLSDIEIRRTVQKCYGNLELLNPHIDEERIVEIDIYNNE